MIEREKTKHHSKFIKSLNRASMKTFFSAFKKHHKAPLASIPAIIRNKTTLSTSKEKADGLCEFYATNETNTEAFVPEHTEAVQAFVDSCYCVLVS